MNGYTEQAIYTIASEVIVAMIRKSEDAVGDARCGFPINTNYTLLHLTGNYKERKRRRGKPGFILRIPSAPQLIGAYWHKGVQPGGANPIYRNTRNGNYWPASGRPFLRTFFANYVLSGKSWEIISRRRTIVA